MSEDPRRELAEIVADLDAHMRYLRSQGLRGIPRESKEPAGSPAAPRGVPTDAAQARALLLQKARELQTKQGASAPSPGQPPLPAASPVAPCVEMPPARSASSPVGDQPGLPSPTPAPLGPSRPAPRPQPTLFAEPASITETVEILTMDAIRERLGDCRRCKLHAERTNLVFGEGNEQAELMFIGEGPGKDEDEQGRPFVGRAGQELTRWIELGMRKSRSDVYIANIVKCRPPNNREPEQDEADTCLPFLKLQIASIKPKALVLLGNTAVRRLLTVKDGITKIRGQWFEYQGIPAMPTYHPSFIIRNPADRVRKGHVWSDLKQVMEKLGWPVPTKGE